MALPDGNEGFDSFSPGRMGNPQDGHIRDRRVTDQDLFDLPRIDVLTAADDHFLFAVNNVIESLFIHSRKVSGVQPPVPNGPFGFLRVAVIGLHDVRPPANQLSDLAGRQLFSVVVDDAGVQKRQGFSDRSILAQRVCRSEDRDARRGLGQPVNIIHPLDVRKKFQKPFLDLQRQFVRSRSAFGDGSCIVAT